jgi:hypothetical protein
VVGGETGCTAFLVCAEFDTWDGWEVEGWWWEGWGEMR